MQELLGANLRQAVSDSRGGVQTTSEDDLLLEAAGSVRPMDRRSSGTPPQTLGARDLVAGWVGLLSKPEALRRALKDWMSSDKTYDVSDSKDALFKQMESRVNESVDFTITGHTHLARALQFPGSGYYYNCGTWIRLLRLTSQVLDDKQAFDDVLWPVLNARRMDALDTALIPGPDNQNVSLLFDRTNAVRISAQDTHTTGDLLRVSGDTRQTVTIAPEPGTTTAVKP